MNYQVGKSAVTSGRISAGAMASSLSVGPATAVTQSVIDCLCSRSAEHNNMLMRLIERTRMVADRMFGETKDGKEDNRSPGPPSMIGALENSMVSSEFLTTELLSEISRLEVL